MIMIMIMITWLRRSLGLHHQLLGVAVEVGTLLPLLPLHAAVKQPRHHQDSRGQGHPGLIFSLIFFSNIFIKELDAALAAVFLGIQKVRKKKKEFRYLWISDTSLLWHWYRCQDVIRLPLQTNFCVNNCHFLCSISLWLAEFDPNLFLIPVTTNSRLTGATLTAIIIRLNLPCLRSQTSSPGSWTASSGSQCSGCPWSQVSTDVWQKQQSRNNFQVNSFIKTNRVYK